MTRIAMGALGVALMAVGGGLLLAGGQAGDVALWLAGALVVHDALVAPLVLAVGLLAAASPARGLIRGALITAGCLTMIALPVMLRPGTPQNATVLPLDYPRNWLLCLAAVAVVAGTLALVRHLRRRITVRRPRRPARGDRPAEGGR